MNLSDARHMERDIRMLARHIRASLRRGQPDEATALANLYLAVVEARFGVGAVALPGRSGLFRVGG